MTIGIVTISYNQAKFLEEAIDSVSVSDPARLRYVIVDPGSKDESRSIIEQKRGHFSRVILEPDRGPADGLNKGFDACEADIYGYLNSDDRFVPGALDFVLDYFDAHPDVDILFGGIRIVDESGRAKQRGRAPDKLDLRKLAYGAYFAWQQSTFFRRSIYERTSGFNIANRVTWDAELVVDMALAGARLGYVNKVLGDFRIYPDSITGSQRLSKAFIENSARIRSKILDAGYAPMSPRREKFEQLKYKLNPMRHLRSTFGMRMPARAARAW